MGFRYIFFMFGTSARIFSVESPRKYHSHMDSIVRAGCNSISCIRPIQMIFLSKLS